MAPKRLEDYVRVYDNVLTKSECKSLIKYYNESDPVYVDHERTPKFHHLIIDYELSKQILPTLKQVLNLYFKDTELEKWQPGKYAYEEFRIKKYRKQTDDQFLPHVDVTDHPSAKRFLAFFVYLNTVKDGGETHFSNISKTVKPKEGRMIVFPPMWMFPHQGRPTITDDKIILSSYLHYL